MTADCPRMKPIAHFFLSCLTVTIILATRPDLETATFSFFLAILFGVALDLDHIIFISAFLPKTTWTNLKRLDIMGLYKACGEWGKKVKLFERTAIYFIVHAVSILILVAISSYFPPSPSLVIPTLIVHYVSDIVCYSIQNTRPDIEKSLELIL